MFRLDELGDNDGTDHQGDVVVDEGGHAGIPDVIVLTVSIQTGRGAQSGVGSGTQQLSTRLPSTYFIPGG